ncbi:MAG: prepilin-type N-terminal cleavage/methylation domain-containing protein [Blastocatellia bacterium]|nr:prepilin-type N-terminal cleavage/methylation domain-containing protein [Blastocatellia bacterium]
MRAKFSAPESSDCGLAGHTPSLTIRNPQSAIRNPGSGFTLLEIIIVITILSILTAAAVPMVRNTVQREREAELRLALRQLRQALDAYKKYYDESGGRLIPQELQTPGRSGYPKDLEVLVEGFFPANVVGTSGARKKFLRRLPIDPMTGTTEWGLRSYKDKPDSTSWGGEDVFDVYSKSDKEALNGTKYIEW